MTLSPLSRDSITPASVSNEIDSRSPRWRWANRAKQRGAVAGELNKVHIRAGRRVMFVVPNLVAQLGDHRLVGVLDEQHRVWHAGVHRVNLQLAAGRADALADAQVHRRREADRDTLAAEPRLDHASECFERNRLSLAEVALGEPRKTARPIAAHLRLAAVAVEEVPAQISIAPGQAQQQHAVRADAALAMADFPNLFRGQLEAKFAVVDQHEIVPGPIHFCEVNQHAHSLPKLGQAGKRADYY